MKILIPVITCTLLIVGCTPTEPGLEKQVRNTERAWQQTEPYIAPSFETFFPDDIEGGQILDTLWESPDKESRDDEEIIASVRNGLRNTKQDKTFILRWIGNKYIWTRSPQNEDAIEIMYHASGFSGASANTIGGINYYAVYFGLSVVHPKTPSILRTLVDLSVVSDDVNTLSRVAWGAKSQQSELLQYLQPYLDSNDEATREKAKILEQIFCGDLNAFEWEKNK